MKSVPKVHIIRTEHTVAEIRDPRYALQNPQATRDQWLHETFTRALKKHGPPFDSSCRPVVAGLILDSHYSVEQNLILGHAALGCHNANGLSLGIFGSHLTYSWPRFLDEIASCLSDSTNPGDSAGNDNNECTSMARACYVGQGAFLHEVGHAFGADHTAGIMARGYSQYWGHNFLAQESEKDHEAKWDLQDALRFQSKPHFRIPGDEPITPAFTDAELRIEVVPYDEASTSVLQIASAAGLAKVSIGDKSYGLMASKDCTEFRFAEFDKLDRSKPLEVSALAMNGKTKTVKDAWKLLASKPYIDIPGTSTKLRKRSIKASGMDRDSHSEEYCQWNVLLRKYGTSGSLSRVSAIDLRVGATFDGVYIYYADGSRQNCGPALDTDGSPFTFGGGSAEKASIPKKARITKIEICERGGWDGLDGIRMTLSTGHVWGCLNAYGNNHRIHTLEPAADEKIVGFFGTSGDPAGCGFIKEFGIITAPKDFRVPDDVYDMDFLQNTGNPGDGDDSMSDAGSDSQSTVS